MVVYSISIEVSGDELIPDSLNRRVVGDFGLLYVINPDDGISERKEGIVGFGSMAFIHPKKFGFSNNLIAYEQWFIDFVENNLNEFKEDLIKKVASFGASIPMSIYKISKNEMREMLEEEGFDKESMLELDC